MSVERLKNVKRDVNIPTYWRRESMTYNWADVDVTAAAGDSLVITAPVLNLYEPSWVQITWNMNTYGLTDSGGWIYGRGYATRIGGGFPVMSDLGYVKLWDVTGSYGNWDSVEVTVTEGAVLPAGAYTYSVRFRAYGGTIRIPQYHCHLLIDVARG